MSQIPDYLYGSIMCTWYKIPYSLVTVWNSIHAMHNYSFPGDCILNHVAKLQRIIYNCHSKPVYFGEMTPPCIILMSTNQYFPPLLPLSLSFSLSLSPSLSPYSLSPPWRSVHQHWFIIYSCAWETSSYWFNAYSNPALYPLLVRDAEA